MPSVLHVTPAWNDPHDPEWYLWPLVRWDEEHTTDARTLSTRGALRFLFLRVKWNWQRNATTKAMDAAIRRATKREKDRERAEREGRLNAFEITCTPAPFSRDKTWYLWPLIAASLAPEGSMTRNGATVSAHQYLELRVLVLRVRVAVKRYLSRRTIEKYRLMDRLPDINGPSTNEVGSRATGAA